MEKIQKKFQDFSRTLKTFFQDVVTQQCSITGKQQLLSLCIYKVTAQSIAKCLSQVAKKLLS